MKPSYRLLALLPQGFNENALMWFYLAVVASSHQTFGAVASASFWDPRPDHLANVHVERLVRLFCESLRQDFHGSLLLEIAMLAALVLLDDASSAVRPGDAVASASIAVIRHEGEEA